MWFPDAGPRPNFRKTQAAHPFSVLSRVSHLHEEHPMNHRKHATTAGAVLLATGALVVTFAATADATQGHQKPSICHPVEGKGETGYGWNLIRPDEASKHIDEATGAGKHTRKDGRTDVYADAAGHCPGFVVVVTPTPTPTPTATVTPSPEPTKPTPAPSPTVTATPKPTPTTSTPGPVPTVTPIGSTPTPTATATPTPTTTKSPAPTASSPAPTVTPTTSSTTPAPVAKVHAEPAGELAQTGAETWHLLSLGALLILIGAGAVAIARRNQFGNHS